MNGIGVMMDLVTGVVAGDIHDAQAGITSAPQDWEDYWAAQHALPTYRPTTPIPPLKVAIAEGNATIHQAVAHVNGDIRQANSYVAQAYAMPNAAQVAMHCGAKQRVPVTPPWHP